MQPSEIAYALIMKFEFDGDIPPLKAYWDKFGNCWTIGWGHTRSAKVGMEITLEEAAKLFMEDVEAAAEAINELVSVGITQNMFDALVSFTFNVGVGNLKHSTLLKLLNAGDIKGCAQEFLKWTYAGKPKRKLNGLVRRRKAEHNLFLQGARITSTEAQRTCPGRS